MPAVLFAIWWLVNAKWLRNKEYKMNVQILGKLEADANKFAALEHKLFIGGKWVASSSNEKIEIINPATEEVIGYVCRGNGADIDKAVMAARAAFDGGIWSKLKPDARAALIYRLADLLEANADEIGMLETLDNGMPLSSSARIIKNAVSCLRYNAGWATKISGETKSLSLPGDWHAFTMREPVGVAGLITPWNVPLTIAINKIAPALAAGCTIVLKPAENTPLSALRLAQLIEEAGFPEGVVNVVTGYGYEAGSALVDHKGVDKISFTGSTIVGKSIMASASKTLKRVSLELGGKSPVIVMDDADLARAIPAVAMSIFANSGQVCVAGSRLFAHKKVFDKVIAGISEIAKSLKVGSGMLPDTQIGPLVSNKQLERVSNFINSGKSEGAEAVVGGNIVGSKGYFIEPTVFANTNASMEIMKEEIFGPVLCATRFDDENLDEIIAQANDTEYGLSANIWTQDISRAHKLAFAIRAGHVKINAPIIMDPNLPFGGFKQSGIGREAGYEGIEAFTELKSIAIGL